MRVQETTIDFMMPIELDMNDFIDQLRESRLKAYETSPGDIREHSCIEQVVLAGISGYRLPSVQGGFVRPWLFLAPPRLQSNQDARNQRYFLAKEVRLKHR